MPTIAPLDLDGHCLTTGFISDTAFFATADGAVHRLDGGHKSTTVHDGMLCAIIDTANNRLLTGGEDGKVCALAIDGTATVLAELGRKWISAVASGPQKIVGYASGKTAYVAAPGKQPTELAHPRTVEGIAFAPKGLRLAVARYNGATLHFPGTATKPAELEWAGAHTNVTFSPDGNFLISSMQENALHGWRISDGKHMRMSGYPAKIKAWSWSVKGKWLATSGAPAAIVWPFQTKDGPMGKAPLELGTRGNAMVTSVSCHPTEDVVAIGYDDGMILAARFADQKEILLRREGKSAVSALAWDAKGMRLAFGSENGDCGLVDITS